VSVSQCNFASQIQYNIGKLHLHFADMLIPGGRRKLLILILRDKMVYAL